MDYGFEDESYISHITTRPSMSSEYKMTKSIKTISLNAVERWKNEA